MPAVADPFADLIPQAGDVAVPQSANPFDDLIPSGPAPLTEAVANVPKQQASPFDDLIPKTGTEATQAAVESGPSVAHQIVTHLFFGGDEGKRQQPNETDEEYRQRLTEGDTRALRPSGATAVVKGIDALTGLLTG